MNNTKTNIIGAIAVIALLAGCIALARPSTVQMLPGATSGQVGGPVTLAAGATLANGVILPNPSTYDYLVSRTYLASQGVFGLGNGSSVPTSITATRLTLTSGTSTPCAIVNPFSATSTIMSFSMNITTATTSAMSWAVGTSTTAYATSTSLETVAVGASKSATMAWDGGVNNSIIGPGQYIVVGSDVGTAAGTGAYTSIIIGGSCQATFQSLN